MATTVPMLAPDGTSGEIPADKVQAAQQAGFKRAFEMTAPDGKTTGYIPQERVFDAAKAGFKLANIDKNDNGEGTYNMWDDGGHKLSIPYSHVPIAQAQGYKFDVNPDPGGLTPAERFQKDSATGLESRGGWNFGDVARGAVQGVKNMVMHPIQTGAGMGAPFVASGMAPNGMYPTTAATGRPEDSQANAQVQQQAQQGQAEGAEFMRRNPAYAIGSVAGPALVTAGLAKAVPVLADAGMGAAGRALAGDVEAPIAGTDLTPAARYASMKKMGLQPNAAEATNSTPLKIAEKVNQNSLTAAQTYADARTGNLKALNDYAEDVLGRMSPQGPEEGGAAVQQALLKSHADLKNGATAAFKDLDTQVGDQPLPGAVGLRQQAQAILDENAPYYKEHPELEPTKAMAIVRDLAGAKGPAKAAPAVIPGFGPTPPAAEVALPRVPTYSELHRLRSDLLDFNNTNPDLVKNQANGWISQLAGAADKAITSGESALTPEQVETFRNANESWKYMKDTFDNPSHPFYHAVRTPDASTLLKGIRQTPEMAKALQQVLGPEEIGPIQRGVAENLLRTTKEGGYNFKTFQGQWNKLPQAYRDALFAPEQIKELEGIGDAGTVLHEDANPSGSARLGQGIAEGAEALRALSNPTNLHELGANMAYHAAHYGLGKLMHSPAFVEWLMKGRGLVPIEDVGAGGTSNVLPVAAGAAAAVADPHTGPNGEPNFYSDAAVHARAAYQASQAENAKSR